MSVRNSDGEGSGPLSDPDDGFFRSDEVPGRPREEVLKYKKPPGTHDQRTRKLLAITIVGVVAAFYGYAFVALVFNWIDNDRFSILIAAISGPATLAGAVVGFYYGGRHE